MSHNSHSNDIDDSPGDDEQSKNGVYAHAIGVEDPSGFIESQYRLLVPVLSESPVENVERIMRSAATIALDREGDLLVLCLVDVPQQTPYEAMTKDQPRVRDAHETAERLLHIAEDAGVAADGIVCLTHREPHAILNVADRHDCDGVFMIVDADRSQRRRLLGGDTVETIVSRADADVFVEKPGERETPTERILLTVSGGPHSGLAAETARALALEAGARIDVIHFLSENATDENREEGEIILGAAEEVLNDVEHVSAELVETKDVAAEMVARPDAYDVTVLGAPTMGLLKQFVFVTVPDSVTQRAENAVLMAKQRTGATSAYYRWIARDPVE